MTWSTRILATVCLVSFIAMMSTNAPAADPAVQLASFDEAPAPLATPESELTYTPQWPAPPDTGAMLLRLVIGTVVVLGLCVGSLWLGKPWLLRLQSINTGGKVLHIEGTVSLGNRAVLYLVKVGDTQLIAGTDGSGLKSLITLPTSFKEVLEEQTSSTEIASATQGPHFEMRPDFAIRSKD